MPIFRLPWIQSAAFAAAAAFGAVLFVMLQADPAAFSTSPVQTSFVHAMAIAGLSVIAHAVFEWLRRATTRRTSGQILISSLIAGLTVIAFGGVSLLAWRRAQPELGVLDATLLLAAFIAVVVGIATGYAAAFQTRELQTRASLAASRSSTPLIIGGLVIAIFLSTGFQAVSVANNVRHWNDMSRAVALKEMLRDQISSVARFLADENAGMTAASIAEVEFNEARLRDALLAFRPAAATFLSNGEMPIDAQALTGAGSALCDAIARQMQSPAISFARLNARVRAVKLLKHLQQDLQGVRTFFEKAVPVIAAGQDSRMLFGPFMIFLYAGCLLLPVMRLAAAHESRLARLSMTLAQTRVPVILSDARHRIVWANKAYEELTGEPASAVIGRFVPSLIQLDINSADIVQRFGEATRKRQGLRETISGRRVDGTIYWIDVDIQPVFTATGRFDGYCTTANDVSSLVEAMQARDTHTRALEASEQKFRALTENSPDIIVSLSVNGEITYASPAVRLFGYEPEELLGFAGYRLLHPEDAESSIQRTKKMLTSGEIAPDGERIMRYLTRDGRTVWLESNPSVLRGPDGAIAGVTLQLRNIDDRKKFMDALAEREALLESITDISGVGGWSLDLATMRPVWSAKARAIHEVDDRFEPTPEDATGFFAPEVQSQIRQAIADGIAYGKPWDLELPLFTARGRRLFVRTTGRPDVRDGKTIRIIGAIQDITAIHAARNALMAARDEAEAALAESARFQAALTDERKRLSNVIEATKVGSWEIDLATGQVWINERWAQMLGYDHAELQPMTFERMKSLVNPDDLAASQHIFDAHIRGETDFFELEQRAFHKDGHEIWVQTRGRIMARAADGTPLLVSGTRQDVSERKAADERSRLLNERLGLAVEASNVGVWEFDFASRKLAWDQRVRELFGVDDAYVPSFERWKSTVHGDDAERTFSDMYRARKVGDIWRAQYRIVRADGSVRHVRSGARFYFDHNNAERIVGVIWDVSAEVRRNEELERRRLEAEAAAMAKSQFLATMSHEIRTPMNGVLGMLNLLMRSELTAEQRGRAEMAHESASGLLTILNDILDFSKLEANQVRVEALPVAVRPLLAEVLALFDSRASEKGLALTGHVDADVPAFIATDPTRLKQILVNLVGNAVKFTETGSVHVTAAMTADGEVLGVQVCDTGIGISEEARGRLFQRFMQADSSTTRKFGGTGLGLAICHQLAGLLGGKIGVEPNPKGGSIFWFTIKAPAAATSEVKQDGGSGAEKPGTLLRPLRILVAEDNRINQKIITAFLAPGGHTTEVAANGEEALAALKRQPYDLVLMDVQMPVMDGITATRAIRASNAPWRNIPIIALTANAMAGDRENYLALGMNGYVSKPINVSTLFAEIAAVTAGSGDGNAATAAQA
ncbi:MAG TPA: PAS domain S-box protein [Micropepsaceae bacterium]|mgnify:CR=1 FL=1|nr:PAS domain S-box protein [Micropepsaceae bacterium]